MQINPTRNFNLLYIILDTLFIIILLYLLIYKKYNDDESKIKKYNNFKKLVTLVTRKFTL